MDIQKNSFLSIDQLANQYLNNSRKTVKAAQENLVSFQEILQSKRDSLVIVDDLAFIVNVPNKTVVTAMDSRETEENVFTNINGAVIM